MQLQERNGNHLAYKFGLEAPHNLRVSAIIKNIDQSKYSDLVLLCYDLHVCMYSPTGSCNMAVTLTLLILMLPDTRCRVDPEKVIYFINVSYCD